MKVLCKDCDKRVDAPVHGVYQYHDPADGPPKKITLLNCPRCKHAVVIEEIEQWDGYWTDPKTVYPVEIKGLSEEIPEALRASFNEAVTCLNARAFNASAIMCRRTLEGLCEELGVKGKNLAASLSELGKSGHIEGSLVEWANALRVVGNESAHNVGSNISAMDSQNLVEFTEAILDYLFVFKKKFEAFKARRNGQSKP